MTILNKVLQQSNSTLKELLITMTVEGATLEDILKSNNIKLGLFDRMELKDQLMEAIKEL